MYSSSNFVYSNRTITVGVGYMYTKVVTQPGQTLDKDVTILDYLTRIDYREVA